ncbi:MAG: hypothetical protein IJ224_02290 [Lachnospiraceae bacterium]|nr:hypothetical protein [Lachnospiraceae bacterium]
MTRFEKMIFDIKEDIFYLINNPNKMPDYMEVDQLQQIIDELDKMSIVKNSEKYYPYYPKGIIDCCWDYNDKIYSKLMDILYVYKKI